MFGALLLAFQFPFGPAAPANPPPTVYEHIDSAVLLQYRKLVVDEKHEASWDVTTSLWFCDFDDHGNFIALEYFWYSPDMNLAHRGSPSASPTAASASGSSPWTIITRFAVTATPSQDPRNCRAFASPSGKFGWPRRFVAIPSCVRCQSRLE